MGVGFTSINDDGIYQIDENSYVLGVVTSGNLSDLTGTQTGEGVDTPYFTVNTSVSEPVFGLYLPANTNYLGGIRKTLLTGNTWTCTYQLWGKLGMTRSLTNAKYFVFGRMPGQGNTGIGLEVYGSSGEIVFNSNAIVKTINGPSNTSIDNTKRYAVISGGVSWSDHLDIDFVTTNTWTHHQWHNGVGYYSYNGGVWSEETVIYDTSGVGPSGGGYETFYYGVNQPAYAIDVTDFTS